MKYKLGSLFDGSGGFPLSGTMCGIEPMWAAEVEPYPIAVTRSRFPNMTHLGDITKVNGADIDPVDIITFGSPCQDLSVAGKRAGLKHEDNGDDETTRSGLFMEAVRIIKEMRGATNGRYPRFACWENVPGAFSSNNGEDFRIVLQELIQVVEPNAVMPEVPKKGWAYADSYSGDGWSLAYRVFDAQYWGVPQRRRRIYLVADFGGQCAEKVLFEREGLRGHFAESGKARETVAPSVEGSTGTDDREGAVGFDRYNQCSTGEVSETLRCPNGGDNYPTVCYGVTTKGNGDAFISKERHTTLSVGGGQAGQGYPCALVNIEDREWLSRLAYKEIYLREFYNDTDRKGQHPVCYEEFCDNEWDDEEIRDYYISKLKARFPHTVCYGISSYDSNAMKSSNPHSGVYEADTSRTLDLNGGNPACNQGGIAVVENVPYTLKIRSGCAVDGKGKVAGKGALIQENLSATLATSNDQYLFQPIGFDGYNACETGDKSSTLDVNCGMSSGRNGVVCMGFDAYNQALTGDQSKTLNSAASDADHIPCAVYSVENHPADSRVNLDESGKVQTLTSRMGTGGGNVPMVMEEMPKVINLNKDDVQSKAILDPNGIAPALYSGECRGGGGECYVMEPFVKSHRASSADDATTWKEGAVANTLNTFDLGETRVNELVVEETATAYGFDPSASRDVGVLFLEECGKTLTNGTCPGHHDGVVIARPIHSMTTGSFMQVEEECSPTLMARDYKDPTCIEAYDETLRQYIVRRLTPTECARLQGFPDAWGHVEQKTEFTDDEYEFWHNVRKTHDAINNKPIKDYNEKQMLTWYNKLWNDGAEYKMWGNGIALPCALFVMEGITDALNADRASRSQWLDELLRGDD